MADGWLTQEDLEAASAQLAGAEIEDLEADEIKVMVTIGQYLINRGLAEIERRGLLEWHEGQVCLPYESDHDVECILTRETN